MNSRLPWSIAGIDFCAIALTERIRCLRALRKESLNRRFVSDSLVQKTQGKKKKKRKSKTSLADKRKIFHEEGSNHKDIQVKKKLFLLMRKRDALFEHRPSGLTRI